MKYYSDIESHTLEWRSLIRDNPKSYANWIKSHEGGMPKGVFKVMSLPCKYVCEGDQEDYFIFTTKNMRNLSSSSYDMKNWVMWNLISALKKEGWWKCLSLSHSLFVHWPIVSDGRMSSMFIFLNSWASLPRDFEMYQQTYES